MRYLKLGRHDFDFIRVGYIEYRGYDAAVHENIDDDALAKNKQTDVIDVF